jgi:hypothetical protein
MGYKQQNNPFSRRISSPLQHNVTNTAGESWKHAHNSRGRTISLEAKSIAGSSDFGKRANRAIKSKETGTKRLSEERGGGRATEKNYAMDYANQLADMYNRGELIGGQFIADDFDKTKSKFSIKNNKVKIKPRFKSVGESKDYNVQYADEVEGFDPEVGYQTAETQYTPDQIYDMMVQGGGMVSIVDGKIVAGNPNEVKYELTDADRENPTFSGTSRYSTSYQDAGYVPEGYMDERSTIKVDPSRKLTVKELLDLRRKKKPVDPNAVVNTTNVDPNRKLSVKELLERRKQKSNSAINRVMGNSPLNTGHEKMTDDERGGYNTQGDPRVNTVTTIEYDEKGRPIGERDVTTTEQDYIRQIEIPGTETPGDTGPNFKEDCEGIVMNVGNVSKSGKFKCDLNPNPPINTPGETVDPEVKEDMYTDSSVEEVYRPYELDPEPVVQRDRFSRDSGSIRGKGFELKLPSVDLSELIKLPQGWFEPKSAGGGRGCGCMVNPR